MSSYYELTVEQVRHETADACSFTLGVPASLAALFAYQAGQFLTFKIAHPEGELLRCYSMSSSPRADRSIQVCVKRVRDGRASNWLCDNIRAGDTLSVMPPAGVFTVKEQAHDLLLFAGGSGVTPVFSILKTALLEGDCHIRLIYANRDPDSIIFDHELRALQQQYPERLEIVHLLDALQGIPKTELLQALTYDMQSAQVYICGPGPFMDSAERALQQAGFASSQIHIERFVSLTTPADIVVDNTKLDGEAEIEIDYYGDTHRFTCAPDQTLLQAAQAADVALPYSCEVGMCASCMCEITAGSVDLLNNDVLTEHDIDNQLIITCQAVPTSDKVSLKYT